MGNTELQFEMAMRDQIIYNQREAQRNLWNLLMGLGVEEKQVFDLAAKQGITIEDWSSMASFPGLPYRKQTPSFIPGNIPFVGHSYSKSSCTFQSYQDPSSKGQQWAPTPTLCREEHHSSYYFMGQEPPAFVNLRKSHDGWVGGSRPASRIDTGGNHRRVSYPQTVNNSSPRIVASHMGPKFYQTPQRVRTKTLHFFKLDQTQLLIRLISISLIRLVNITFFMFCAKILFTRKC